MTNVIGADELGALKTTPLGPWFKELETLGFDLLSMREAGALLPKVLAIQLPTRDLAAVALALGMSSQAIFSAAAQEVKLNVDDLGTLIEGSLVQLRFAWHPADRDPSSKSRRVVTGSFRAFRPAKAGTKYPVLNLDTGKKNEFISITDNVVSVFSMPPETPLGTETQRVATLGVNLERWGSFFTQQRPTACTFTYLGEFEEELNLQISGHPLLDDYLGLSNIELKAAARFDRLTEDQHAHFVNAYEMLAKFQRLESEIAPRLEPFEIVVFDGNVATANLVENSLFRRKTKICLIENSDHIRLGDAVDAIAREVMYLSKREDLSGTPFKRDRGSLTTEVWD
jgi:hypothetical protein